jgi:subtilisin family serine protease
MRASLRRTSSFFLILALAGALTAAARQAPRPATNDFLLRVPASAIDGIALQHGLEVLKVVSTSPDPLGRNLYLVRAPQGVSAAEIIQEVLASDPQAAGMEQAVLASLPETYKDLNLVQRTRAILGQVIQASRLVPPGGKIDSYWIGPVTDRQINRGETKPVIFNFKNPASANPADYGLTLGLDGTTRTYNLETRACGAAAHGYLAFGDTSFKWKITNAGSQPVTLSSLSISWPLDGPALEKVKLGGTEIFSGLRTAPSTLLSTWKVGADQLRIPAGQTKELTFELKGRIPSNLGLYSINTAFAEGCTASFAPGGEAYSAAISAVPSVQGSEVRFQVTNTGSQTLTLSSLTPRWPAANGRIVEAKLNDKRLIDTVIESPFGTNPDGTVRNVWRAYVEQTAAAVLRVNEATKDFKGRGAVVAIIDSGVDPDHPILRNALLPGYDFTRDLATASEWNDVLDQRTRAILGQRTRAILGGDSVQLLNASTAAVLDSTEAGQLDPSTIPPAFGHGTMVAGVVHRVAPEAKILPLKAFDGNGQGHLFNVVRAIYYAVDQGVTVINMSFSVEEFSPELMRAVNYAVSRGVACVASAGNDGKETLVFPASLGGTIGVASTTSDDRLSSFSNHGSDLVTISAPGEDIVTTYPGGGWALASGTSFSAPWISGIAAAFAEKNGRGRRPDIADFYLANQALSYAVPVVGVVAGDVGFGRADLAQAVEKLKGGLTYDGPDRANYSITVTLSNGCTLTYPPADGSACSVEPRPQLEFPDDHRITWRLTNTGTTAVTIQSLTIQWPGENGNMKSIQWNGGTIYDDHGLPPRLDLRLGIDKPAPRLDPGQTGILKLEFDSKALTT